MRGSSEFVTSRPAQGNSKPACSEASQQWQCSSPEERPVIWWREKLDTALRSWLSTISQIFRRAGTSATVFRNCQITSEAPNLSSLKFSVNTPSIHQKQKPNKTTKLPKHHRLTNEASKRAALPPVAPTFPSLGPTDASPRTPERSPGFIGTTMRPGTSWLSLKNYGGFTYICNYVCIYTYGFTLPLRFFSWRKWW